MDILIQRLFEILVRAFWFFAQYSPLTNYGIVLGRQPGSISRRWSRSFVILAWVPVLKQDDHGAPARHRIVLLRLMCNRISGQHRSRVWIDASDAKHLVRLAPVLVLDDTLAAA